VVPLQRQTVANLTLDAIRERILHGIYPEGEPLRQETLAAQLGVSHIPIREALRQLETEGLVTFSPYRGAIVSTLSVAEIEEIFELRAELEVALLRRAIPHVTAEHLTRAEEILTRYERALRSGDIRTWGEMNWKFHSTLYAPAERPIALGIVHRLHRQAERYVRMQLALTHGESQANEEHRALAAVTRRKDVRRASQLLRQHILGAGGRLVAFLKEQRQPAELQLRARTVR
jgi:DNA-binding GntR family transcriptional regulator